jgi:DNA-binding XRE family transcriptional regulator
MSQSEPINGVQLRTGRAFVGWTQADLARRSGVSKPTIVKFELERGEASMRVRRLLRASLEFAGVIFRDGRRSETGFNPRVLATRGKMNWRAKARPVNS